MGKLDSVKSSKKSTICYIITIVVLSALTIGFLVAFIKERNKQSDIPQNDSDSTTSPSSGSTSPTPPPTDLRLPRSVLPIHYDLTIEANHQTDQFNGLVVIQLNISEPTNEIKIHSYLLDIPENDVKVVDERGSQLNIKSFEYQTAKQFNVIELNAQMNVGTYQLSMSFNGSLVGKIIGFYKSNYTNSQNQIRQFSATKFEPTYARQAFPCFDEPNIKSTYNISIIHDKNLNAISNGIQIDRIVDGVDDNKVKTVFNKTVQMSTYLVAYVISDFKYTQSSTVRGKMVRVFSKPDQVANTKYALNTAIKILEFYEKFFGIDYPLEKLDLVALPVFVSGAMENWGIITFRETNLLYSEDNSSTNEMRRVAAVIAHELAHMWFGNLVTMDWWDDLWLNEGFASYIEYRGQNASEPNWNIDQFFLSDDLHGVMRLDALDSSHPIIQPVTNPDQITEIFDTISYSKGSSVLRMLEYAIGSDVFREGVIDYINQHLYSNAKTQDLWDSIQKIVDKKPEKFKITKFMDPWTKDKGFPVVNVKRVSTNKINVRQQKFPLNSGEQNLVDEETNVWPIYLTFTSSDGAGKPFTLDKSEDTISIEKEIPTDSWIKFNVEESGFYIVNYEPEDWKLLIDLLKNNKDELSPVDRANLIFDASMLAESGSISYSLLFDLLSYVKNEDNLIPWMAAQSCLNRLDDKLESSGGGLAMKQFTKELTQDIYSSLGWQFEGSVVKTLQQKLLRSRVISMACNSGNQDCLNEALKQFKQFMSSTDRKIDPDFREYVYSYGMKMSGSSEDWNKLWDLWRTEVSASERSKLLNALTSVQNSQLLSRLIQYSNDSSVINDQDFFTVQQSIAGNSIIGRQLVWDYMRNNWDHLLMRFTANDRRLGTYVSSICSGFNTKTQLKEMQDFFETQPDSGAGQNARNQALERVRNNIQWLNTNEDNVVQWLDSNTQTLNPWLNWRLGSSVIPQAYVINWNVDLSSDTFNGSVTIEVDVKEPINHFILHQKGLEITESKAYSGNMKSFKSLKRSRFVNNENKSFAYEPNDFWVIPTDTTIRPSTYVLYLEFNGNLSTGLNGLYKSVYPDSNNVSKGLATTQFQSTYARQALPCFDEPQFKSTFNITVTHSAEYNALSNMPVTDTSVVDNTTVTKFDVSVKMVTYLVALVVSDFECFKSTVDNRVQTCAAPGNREKLNYALEKTPQILKFYEKDYFDISYPLPKLDNIAIPDFSAGAMENWGLVTYREIFLFYDPSESSTRDQMRVCMIISHELAHMWFGNLVTTKWWDDLWLNEGFATYMSYKAVGRVEPDWRYDEIFALDELARVFEADSTPNTHAILASVKNADDISSVFDAITYGKGASILRMLETALGADNFRVGIKNYLTKYAYQNTLTAELWTELTEAHPDKLNVSEFMDSWVTRKGFPVVTITRNSTSNKATLKQELFLKDSSDSQTTYFWKIPVTYRALTDQTVYTEWLEVSQKSVYLKTDSDLIKFNADQSGLFIVNYPTNVWKKWSKELNDEKSKVRQQLSPLDRSELINDAFYLARSGRLDYELALNLSQYLRYEDSLIPWTTVKTMFSYIKNLIYSDADIALNYYINDIIGQKYRNLSWEDVGDAQTRRLRTVIIDMACGYRMEECLSNATDKFAEWKSNSRIAPNLLPLVLKYGIRHSSHSDDFYYLRKRYIESNSAQEKLIFLQGLTSTTNEALIDGLLNSSSDETFVRKHDFFTFLTNIALNSRTGASKVWNYFRDNYQEIEKRFTINNSNLGRIVYTLSTTFTTEAQKQEVLDLFKKYPKSGAGKLDRDKALEVLETNILWLKNYKNKVIEWITNRCPKAVCPWNVYRLNEKIVPIQYYLTVQVNTTTNVFNGSVQIEVKADTEVEYFIVHSADILDVTSGQVFDNLNNESLEVKQMFNYSPLQFLVLRLVEKQSAPKTYRLGFEFKSNLLLGGLSGLYKSTYELKGEKRGLAATQFQATSARKAFPCFDEPSFRSKFDVTLIHDNHNNLTISNQPIAENLADNPVKGWTTTKYERTVPMVTYLLALLVSDFACRSDNTSHPYEIRVCSSLAKENKLQYALESTPEIFTAFENYLDYPYQLNKSDLIAIPDFSAGAMENWGLVKFRETALLWTPKDDQSSSKMSVNSIIAHELAHMWFGNLLTCHFWGDLWLNEGFASFMEYPATNFSEPDWDYWDTFVYYDLSSAVSADSYASSAPIVRKVLKPSDMSYSSAIVYNKGSTIIRMMEFAMGQDNFKDGIRKYLKKHEYQTVVTQNLWDSLNETFPKELDTNIYQLMDSWTMKAGFPYINITRNADNSLSIIQERFLSNGQKPVEDTLWTIPLSFYTSLDTGEHKIIPIKTKQQTIPSSELPSDQLIKFNVDYRGMYFVNYPLEDWDKWITALVNDTDNILTKLTPSDRTQFILDAFYLAKANKLPLLKAYNLTKYMVNEEHFTPWAMFNSMFDNRYRLTMTQYKDSLFTYLSYLSAKQYLRLGWNDADGNDITKRLRALIVDISCTFGNQKCLEDAYQEFTDWKSGSSLAPNLRDFILRFGIQQSNDSEDFEFVWNTYLNTNTSLKSNYLNALTYSDDKNQLKSLLDRSLDDRSVSVNNFVSVMQEMAGNSVGLPIVWQFFRDNYEMLIRKLTSNQLANVFDSICQYFGDNIKRREVENFLKLHPNNGLSNSSRDNSLSKITANYDWINDNSDTIGQWLAENGCGPEPCPWSVYRLNSKIKPIKYYPTIQVNVTTNVYNGSVAIEVNATESVLYFIVHASSILNVTNARVFVSGTSRSIPTVKTFRYKPHDFFVIQLFEAVGPKVYRLEYEFNGNLLMGGLSGLYRSSYTEGNETIGLASTQFEFTDARKAFPCFDEPSFKSTFELTLIHDKHMNTTLSNMPIIENSTDLVLNWTTTKYEESVQMVTYLVAMVVSDFVCKQDSIDDHLVGVCASRVQSHKLDYAMDSTKKCLHHLEKDYLQIDYPLPKVDMIAIPDFAYGAMENWGLVTFRELRLVWDQDSDTSANKMSTIAVIAHELAHFWFGNLVTCQWWSHFWLNEGFATFMEYKAVNYSEPDWGYFDLFMISDYVTAVTADSLTSSHPLVRKVENPFDVQQYSSSIVYSKGASVIRMIESVMGSDNFQLGIQSYLRNNSFNSAVTQDLLDALNPYYPSDLSVNIFDLMDSWTMKAGFPYINITKESDNSYTIRQERFLADGKAPKNDTIWTIPLTYYKSIKTREQGQIQFIRAKNQTITIDDAEDGLIKFNVDNKGMYFVNYPLEVWDQWIKALVDNSEDVVTNLTASDRASFLLDSFFLSRAGFLPYVKPLQLAKYLVRETHLTPWSIALNSFQQIRIYMSTTEHRNEMTQYFIELSQPLYDQLGWDDSSGTDTQKRLRAAIIEFVCSLYHKPCLESALQEYSKWKSGQKLAPNLLTSTLRYGIRQSDDRMDWDFLWQKYLNESSASVKQTYLNALSYTTDPELIKLLLNRALDPKLIRTQDTPTVLSAVASNSDGLPIVWEFYKENYQKLIGKLSTIQLGTVLNSLCSHFTNTSKKQEVENFLSANQYLGVTNFDKNRAIESINSNIDWMDKHKEEIGNFLTCGSDSCPWTSYRLNEKIIPVKYWLDFNIDVVGNRFNGNASIEVNATEEIEYFIVHAAESLNITETRVFVKDSEQGLTVNKTLRNIPFEFWVIQMEDKLPPNTYKLVFEFESELNQNMVGLYRSQYYKDNESVTLAATQFQATHARKAFPCFDEPSFKSRFEVTITSASNMNLTISNTREHKSVRTLSDGTDSQTLHFEETVPMVTYLLAMVVSDFVCKQTALQDATPVRVCSSSVEEHKLDYSLDVSPKLLDYFGNYLDFNYSIQGMKKVDFIAIPDFSAGAMENWGLITFRETAMLWEESESTTANKMSVISVIAHEITHMWFGNLLTCKWWSDLWLNEAFASYLEYTSVSNVENDWNYTDLFLMTDYMTAISSDSSATSHPIVRPVNSPAERAYTSAIVYQKGASVLRMLEFVMGSDSFESALRQYIKKYVFQTVVTKQLWDELNLFFPKVHNTTVYELMESWTTKAGFPYLNITRDSSEPNKLTVKQRRFLSNGQTLDLDTVWTVPLSYYTSMDPLSEQIVFIKQKEQTINITTDESLGGLLKLNTDNKGMYFVNYPEEDWNKWIDALTNNQSVLDALTPSDRTNFIIDSFYLSRAGLLSYLKPLELTKYLSKETHLQPWSVAISMFAPIRRYLSSTESNEDLDLYLSGLAQQTYERLGWNDTQGNDVERRLRSTILEFICSMNYEPCLQRAQDMYYEWRVIGKLPPNILAPALRYAIRRINLSYDWNNLWQIYRESTSTVLKLTYLNALAFTSNTDLIKQLLDYSLNERLVRKQDYISVLNYVIRNPDGLSVMWDYYRHNYTLLGKHLSEGQLGTVVNNICQHFNDDIRRKEVKDFFDSNPGGVTQNERKRALETIDSNINWINTNKHLVGNWLKTQTFISNGTKNIKIWSKHKNRSKGL